MTTRSSPTSARSSTWSRSARRARPATRAAARTSCPATTSTRSPCRSRSRRSTRKSHTIGVWASTNRKNVTVNGKLCTGWTQVSRLGNPLINEVVIPTGMKDLWNRTSPAQRRAVQEVLRDPDPGGRAEQAVQARRPGDGPRRPRRRARHGHPEGDLHGQDLRGRAADQPLDPASTAKPNRMGVLGGDNAGFPNGRRLADDVVDIEEQAVAGFLKGKKVPLGDGVNANDDGVPRRTSRTCRPRTRATRTRRRPTRQAIAARARARGPLSVEPSWRHR